jgi:hypothetical protein
MLDNFAWWFFVLAEFLTQLNRQLGLPPPQALAPPSNALAALMRIPPPVESAAATAGLALPPPKPITPPNALAQEERKEILDTLDWVASACEQIGMIGIMNDIGRARRDAEVLFADRQKLRFHIEHITERVVDELRDQSFLHIPPERIKYYEQKDLFGDIVGGKFPNIREDLANAGTAYAVGLNTACVFHLMRVMEHCVQRLARRLKVSVINIERESWHQIMLHVHKQVSAIPGGSKSTSAINNRKQQFAVAASRLDHVRIAWRNDVMHPKATYDQKEAFDVLMSVRAFLESIVKLV